MAEVAAVASIVGIAGFGIQLTQTLYEFGSNVSSAREQTGYIARHVDLYSNVLDILTDRLDAEDPILSGAALDLIDELKFQSEEIFTKIEKSLPNPKEGKDDISFLQKVKWNFTKNKVALLVGELDYLRSTVHLLVTIIFTGRQIRSRRKRKPKADSSGNEVDQELRKQAVKAQNALLAHHQATEKLPGLEQQAESPNDSDATNDDTGGSTVTVQIQRMDVICMSTTALSDLQSSLAPHTDPTKRQQVVLQRSPMVLQQLLRQWTTVDLRAPEAFNAGSNADTPEAAEPESKPKTNKGASTRYVPALSVSDRTESPGLRARPTERPLPDGWYELFDSKSGRYYYSNLSTRQTQWDAPRSASCDDSGPTSYPSLPSKTASNDSRPFERQRTPYSAVTGNWDQPGTDSDPLARQPSTSDGKEVSQPTPAPSQTPNKDNQNAEDLFTQFPGGIHHTHWSRSTSRASLPYHMNNKPHHTGDLDTDSDSDLGSNSGEEEAAMKKGKRKGLISAGLAGVAAIHAAHNVYQSMEKRNARRQALKEGDITFPETTGKESRQRQTTASYTNKATTKTRTADRFADPQGPTTKKDGLSAEDIFTQFSRGPHQAHQSDLKQTSESSSGLDPQITCRGCRGRGYDRARMECSECNGPGDPGSKIKGSWVKCPICKKTCERQLSKEGPCKECKGKGSVPSDYYSM